MAKKKEERKAVLERTYTIPLRKQTAKVPRYRKSKRAVKTIREFLARHMKVAERNLDNVKIDKWLNMTVWHRGSKNPPSKIKVKAVKYSDGIVEAELAELPKQARMAREKETDEMKRAEEKRKAKESRKTEEEKAREEEAKKEEEERAEKLKEEERLLQKIKKTEHELIKPKKDVHRRVALEK